MMIVIISMMILIIMMLMIMVLMIFFKQHKTDVKQNIETMNKLPNSWQSPTLRASNHLEDQLQKKYKFIPGTLTPIPLSFQMPDAHYDVHDDGVHDML